MHFVMLAEHTAEVCPTGNSRTREVLLELAPEIPGIAERNSVKIVSGPYVNRAHIVVAVLEAETAENVDRFIVESRLSQWNTVRLLPSLPMEEGLADLQSQTPMF